MIDSFVILSYLLANAHKNPSTNTAFQLQLSARQSHHVIPNSFTCYGHNQSLPLYWNGAPKNTRSFALFFIDMDAPRSHSYLWALYNIPPQRHHINKNQHFYDNTRVAYNSWGKQNYHSPCPRHGLHHYIILLHALNVKLKPKQPLDAITLRKITQLHILATATLYRTVTAF